MSIGSGPHDESSLPTHRPKSRRKEPIAFVDPKLETLSDEDLASALAGGATDALTILFERHSGIVFSIARRMLRDAGEAEETLQQVFLDMYRAINQFDRRKAAYKTWLLQFAYHRTINRKRQLDSKGFYLSDGYEEEVLGALIHAESNSPILQLASPELVHLVEQLLNTIEARQRKTIELTFFDGLTAEEIAAQTGETANVVRHNLYRGLKKLRQALLETNRVAEQEKIKRIEGILFAQPRTL